MNNICANFIMSVSSHPSERKGERERKSAIHCLAFVESSDVLFMIRKLSQIISITLPYDSSSFSCLVKGRVKGRISVNLYCFII